MLGPYSAVSNTYVEKMFTQDIKFTNVSQICGRARIFFVKNY
jgi:hypothetical protein